MSSMESAASSPSSSSVASGSAAQISTVADNTRRMEAIKAVDKHRRGCQIATNKVWQRSGTFDNQDSTSEQVYLTGSAGITVKTFCFCSTGFVICHGY
ncbi:hypothetical protein N7510_010388 [Penicillium lagena]|uniref:uncharacterized protein n=1 Tax=Penicillium lagena TaxID=94218 RepID=UPI0025416C43|nr:uncharacterized protein N7510_010388 [Penicillium lagena]KAJ5605234.1 hypothetical protein N7510_010388 [Penicillium lagena]